MSLRFSEILGQDEIKDYFKNAIFKNKLVHAYIINGEEGSGKMMLSETVSCALLCENEGEEPCNECTSCHKIINHNHPDVIYVQHEKRDVLSVDEIRTQLVNTIIEKPYSAKRKVYIVPDADKMNVQAQNALLKTIEEPSEYAIIFLLTNNMNKLLPTILSRCIKITLKPVDDKKIMEYLMRVYQVPDFIAKEAAAFAQGNVGLAKSLVASEEFKEERKEFVSLVNSIPRLQTFEIAGKVKEFVKAKKDTTKLLNMFRVWFRDVLLYKATRDESYLIYVSDLRLIQEMSKTSYRGIEKVFEELNDAENKLNSNVSAEQVLSILLIKVKEYIQNG